MKSQRQNLFLAALVVAGAFTFFFALAKRVRIPVSPPYLHPEGGEREGEFELFIGS